MPDKKTLASRVIDFVEHSGDNDLGMEKREKNFDRPLVGFSSGADPLYDFTANILVHFIKNRLIS